MSSSDEEGSECDGRAAEQLRFVQLLEGYPCLMNKSQLPSVKAAKAEAMLKIVEEWSQSSGKHFKANQIQKKINNMKTKVKTKSQSGKKSQFNEWERIFVGMIGGQGQGSVASTPSVVGTRTTPRKIQSRSSGVDIDTNTEVRMQETQQTPEPRIRSSKTVSDPEKEDLLARIAVLEEKQETILNTLKRRAIEEKINTAIAERKYWEAKLAKLE